MSVVFDKLLAECGASIFYGDLYISETVNTGRNLLDAKNKRSSAVGVYLEQLVCSFIFWR